ncbi:hypothetical protein RND81_10G139200 [Saponaria officinalis]|uniref:DUF674 domain-containing protein n=1 Tax=Saponaria officinalis TaxID=3572 RepID=A0AAW1I3A0_SAPOF
MAETSEEKKLTLKLMVDVKAKKVVFAEANKKFVDFIFSLITMPLSSVTKVLLLNKKNMVGCVGTLYKTIASLDRQCFEQNMSSSSVLKPRAPVSVPLLSFHDSTDVQQYTYVPFGQSIAPTFGSSSNESVPGYVIGGTMYMVADNLEVKPMSISLIKSRVKEFDVLEEKQVQVGLQEGLAILKASMETDTVLTTVFLDKI